VVASPRVVAPIRLPQSLRCWGGSPGYRRGDWLEEADGPALTSSCLDAVNQGRSSEGLRQKADCSSLERSRPDAVIGEGRDKNKRDGVTLGAHMGQQVQAAHTGHLHIRDDTRRIVKAV